MDWQKASDLQQKVNHIVKVLDLSYIDPQKIFLFRSQGSRSRARARIWGFPRIWQKALNTEPFYCLEVLSEKFDNLKEEEKIKTLIHELLHIPKNFSGALLPHRLRNRKISLETEKLFLNYLKYKKCT